MPATGNTPNCEWCGKSHTAKCPLITAVEYHQNGQIKRIEFLTPQNDSGPVPMDGVLKTTSTTIEPAPQTTYQDALMALEYGRDPSLDAFASQLQQQGSIIHTTHGPAKTSQNTF